MRGRIAPVAWSIALHAALGALLYVGISLPAREPEDVVLPIDAVVMDQAVIEAARRPQPRVDRAAERRAEAERLERERQERERIEAEQQRQREEAEARRQEEERRIAAERAQAEAKRAAEEQARREAEERARREAEAAERARAEVAKRRAEQEARARAEAELRARLAEEEARTSPGYQSLKASYVAAIQAHVERRWFEPPGTAQGLVCRVYVTQIPGGEVVGTRFGACNGNAAVRQSIETAVRNASPLPPPPEPSLFEREIELVFTPKESSR